MRDALLTLGLCFLVTEMLETGAALALGVRRRYDVLTVILVNMLTNPAAVLLDGICSAYLPVPRFVTLLVLELAVWLIEGRIYKALLDYKKIRPYILSFILNLVSFALGTFLLSFVFRAIL